MNPVHGPRVAAEGFNPYRATIEFLDQDTARQFASSPKTIRTRDGVLAPNFHRLQKLLDVSRENKIRVTLVILPFHIKRALMLRTHGLWTAFQDWKKTLVEIVDTANLGSSPYVELWDFSRPSADTTHSIPFEIGTDKGFFWEPGHFKSDLGNVMLDAIFKKDAGGTWGHQLTSKSIDRSPQEDSIALTAFEVTGTHVGPQTRH